MKKLIVLSLLSVVIWHVKAQYQGGFGVYVSTARAVTASDFKASDAFVYELSFKAFTSASSCVDIIGGYGKDYLNLTLLMEMHHPIFYPVDWYLGVGGHVGSWQKNHWTDTAKHDNVFAGLDGSFGLQLTLFPLSFNVGLRPVYNLYGGDEFYWLKQVGVRICFR